MEPEITREEYQVYLRNDPYYLEEWERIKGGDRPSFNFYAFILSYLWMLYRKMYLVVLLLFLLFLVEFMFKAIAIATLDFRENSISLFFNILHVGYALIIGFYGNKLYLLNAERRIRSLKKKNLPEEEYFAQLYQIGGSTYIPLIILLGFVLALMLAQSYFL